MARKFFVPLALGISILLTGALQAQTTLTSTLAPETTFGQRVRETATRAASDAELRKKIAPILTEAQRVRDLPLITRATSLEQLKNAGSDKRLGGIDARTWVVIKSDPRKAELFVLASADLDTTTMIARELPLLAAAYVVTGEKSYAQRVNAQLREIASWKPLQRPGWMLYKADNNLPADGNDGAWLSSGVGLIAICQTLEIMPPGSIEPDVLSVARQQLADECNLIVRDWKAKKMWFVKQHVPTTNQWIAPSSGLAIASAVLGREANPEAYDLGAQCVAEYLNALGTDGGVAEGLEYGMQYAVAYSSLVNHYFRLAGDDRFANHAFMRNFPRWVCANFQPGQSLVNSSDGFGTNRNMYHTKVAVVAQAAVLSGNPMIHWLMRNQIRVNALNLYGLMAASVPDSELREPELWAYFDGMRSFMWRDSWNDDASGVWVRGGSQWFIHEHWDRGHVNFISKGKIVLMEAGTAGYDSPIKRESYDSLRGHNVLQIGDQIDPKLAPASLVMNSVSAAGGDITVNATPNYPDAKLWERRIVWKADRMEITDRVELKSPKPILFRWHLGSENSLDISAKSQTEFSAHLPPGVLTFKGWNGNPSTGNDWKAPEKDVLQTPEVHVALSADLPIVVEQEKDFDHTLKFRVQKHEHTTLVVRSAEPITNITIKTILTVP